MLSWRLTLSKLYQAIDKAFIIRHAVLWETKKKFQPHSAQQAIYSLTTPTGSTEQPSCLWSFLPVVVEVVEVPKLFCSRHNFHWWAEILLRNTNVKYSIWMGSSGRMMHFIKRKAREREDGNVYWMWACYYWMKINANRWFPAAPTSHQTHTPFTNCNEWVYLALESEGFTDQASLQIWQTWEVKVQR